MMESKTMTLWEARQLAARKRRILNVRLTEQSGLGNGRTERRLSVSPHLITRGVAVQQGTTADWQFVSPALARSVEVEV